jgi:cytochrome oxidase Cu insertion factor (SCO1/SenC/PrrC family)
LPFNEPVSEFSLTDQDDKTITLADLKGKVWIAGFIFTRCPRECVQITTAMRGLLEAYKDEPRVRLISVTVDPEFDTPPVLKKYAERFAADGPHWRFLTGPPDRVNDLIRKGFWLATEKNTTPGHDPAVEVTHSVWIWVVDQNGHKRAHFSGTNPEELVQLRHTVKRLLEEGP